MILLEIKLLQLAGTEVSKAFNPSTIRKTIKDVVGLAQDRFIMGTRLGCIPGFYDYDNLIQTRWPTTNGEV